MSDINNKHINILLEKKRYNKALEFAYKSYSHLVYGVCLKYLKNKELSLDAVSEIYLNLKPKLKKYKITDFNSWIYSLSRNYCLELLRKQDRIKRINSKLKFELKQSDNYDFALDSEIQNLEIAINKLTTKQQECINLFYYKNKSYQEIANITGYNIKNVKSYLQNGKNKLRKTLNN